jgi:hypothetical protein
MKNYINMIKRALQDKLGISNTNSLDYKELPYGEKEKYNTSKIIGNKNLVARRFKTEKEVDELVDTFLAVELP